jgi:hypothetical protein
MLTPLELTLLFIIAGLLLLCAWQSWHHERTMERLSRPVDPPLRWPLSPVALMPEALAAELSAARHMPFLLERQPDRLTPTRRMEHPIHPPFRSHGTDVSYMPTIGIV